MMSLGRRRFQTLKKYTQKKKTTSRQKEHRCDCYTADKPQKASSNVVFLRGHFIAEHLGLPRHLCLHLHLSTHGGGKGSHCASLAKPVGLHPLRLRREMKVKAKMSGKAKVFGNEVPTK